jgi:hypothetical protein
MAYWLDDGFDGWRETIRAGSAAVGLYVRCGAWIARNTQDGFVPPEVAAMYGTPEWVKRLVDAGLWEVEADGYRDVFYFKMGNPTAAVVAKRKADAAERQRRFREGSKGKNVTRDKTRDSRGKNAVSNGGSHASPALPPSKEGKGAAAHADARASAAAPDRTSPLVDAPQPAAKPPDLTAVKAQLVEASRKAKAVTSQRDGSGLAELRTLTGDLSELEPPDQPATEEVTSDARDS